MKKILIIEDNFYIVSKILKKLDSLAQNNGAENLITAIPTLEEANQLAYIKYDILLIDHDLPDGHGTFFLFSHKDNFENILAISSLPENNHRLLECGAHDAINKMDKQFLDKLELWIKKYLEDKHE